MKEATPDRHKAIVVGGGPAGAMLAYLLAKFGVSVLLIERQHDFIREFRGEGLSPSGQAMFWEAGLWDQFDSLPNQEFERIEIYYKGKKMIGGALDWQGLDYPPRFVSQPAMLEMLVAQADKFENFTFLRGDRVTAPIFENGRVTGVRVKEGEGTRAFYADFVFAADGRFSLLRKETGLDEPREPQFFDVVWCKINMPEFTKEEPVTVRGYFGNGHFGLAIPSYDNKLQVGWVIPKGSYKSFREMGIEGWMEEMAGHIDLRMGEHFKLQKNKTLHPFLLDVVCDHYPNWSVPGMVLLGDAAHPMSPVGAQGINIALRDAIVASNHFVPVLADGARRQDRDIAAVAFQEERRKEVLTIQKMQARGPKFLLSQGIWVDGVVATIRFLAKTGLFAPLAKLIRLDRNPFIAGVADVRLRL